MYPGRKHLDARLEAEITPKETILQSTLSLDKPQARKLFFTPWRLACIAICLISGAVFIRALSGLPVWDDHKILSGVGVGGHHFLGCFTYPFLGRYFRPLVSVAFTLDHVLLGDSPIFYHQTNILLHLLTTAALIGLLRTAFGSRRIALLGGLLFAVQPTQVSTVAWIGGRTDSLCALWVVLFAWALIGAVRENGRKRALLLTASAIAYSASLLTKEQTLALLLLVPLAFLCFAPADESHRWRTGWKASLPFALLSIVFVVFWVLYFPKLHAGYYGFWAQMGMTGRSILTYSLLLVTPTARWMHTMSLVQLQHAGVWTALLGWALFLLYALLFRRWLRTAPAAAWFLALSALIILPVSNLIPLPSLTVAPYRAGVAGIGVAALLGYVLGSLLRRFSVPRRMPALQMACGLLALTYVAWCASLTWWGAAQWTGDVGTSATFIRYDPDSLFTTLNLITALDQANKPAQAEQQAEAALTRVFGSQVWRQKDAALRAFHSDPGIAFNIYQSMNGEDEPAEWVAVLYAHLGTARLDEGNIKDSLAPLQIGKAFYRESLDINTTLGEYAYHTGDYRQAIAYLMYAQAKNPHEPDLYRFLGNAYLKEKRWGAAREQFRYLIHLRPWNGQAYMGLASAQMHLGDYIGAEATLQAATQKTVLGAVHAKDMLARIRQEQEQSSRSKLSG